MTTEKRKSARISVNSRINVIDLALESSIGQLVNISESGFMLRSHQQLPLKKLFQLQLLFADSDIPPIELGAESLWEQELAPQTSYWYGFQIFDISNENIEAIKNLTDKWAS
ncbi:MAG: PilZ domain-containing protein [Chromatiales bacterium]|nr:PilZ domain-containing protein [Chromatiales bacterium]